MELRTPVVVTPAKTPSKKLDLRDFVTPVLMLSMNLMDISSPGKEDQLTTPTMTPLASAFIATNPSLAMLAESRTLLLALIINTLSIEVLKDAMPLMPVTSSLSF